MLTKTFSHALVLVGLLTFSRYPCVYGQATGSISGTVTDATGSAVPNAKVTVTAPATGAVAIRHTPTQGGEYIVPLLGVANYNIQVELQGFQTAKADDIRLQVDEHRELDFKLTPGIGSDQRGGERHRSGDSDCGRHSGAGDHHAAGGRFAVERPRLRAACHADAGRIAGNQSEQLF